MGLRRRCKLKRLKDLEVENGQVKAMYAELAMDLKVAKEIIDKKLLIKSFNTLSEATDSRGDVPTHRKGH